MAEINAMDLFREEMGNEEIFLKVNAVHRLTAIAKIIGPEGTRSQLLPFIEKLIPIESDEVLFALAQEISNLRLHIAGSVIILLPPLEILSSCDETVVREQAVSSLVKLTEFMNENEITNHFAPLVLRLSQGETFSCRVSACNLFVSSYKKSGGQRDKLRQKFIELCHEETPMVRRATAAQIGDFGCVVEKEALVNELIPVFRNLAQDDQDAVRMNIINSLIPLAKNFSKEDNLRHALPVALQAGEDKSWRVRLQIAKRFPELAEAFGREIVDSSLIQTFTLLLKDGEPEVRKEAVISLSRSLSLISQDKLLSLVLPSVTQLVNESQTTAVKSNVATTIAEFACSLGKEVTFQRLSQPIQDLLKDENSDVKLNMLKGLNKILESAGLEIINGPMLQILQKCSTDLNWRVREQTISLAATIGITYGQEAFERLGQDIFFMYLSDSVWQVHKTSIKQLPRLFKTLQLDWVKKTFLQKIQDNQNKEIEYFYRQTVIFSVASISEISPPEQFLEIIIPFLEVAAKDKVPNVRFSICQVLIRLDKKLSQQYKERISSSIRPILESLIKQEQEQVDRKDKDVLYFAQEAIQKYKLSI